MDKNRNDRDGYEGRLPDSAPLANPYVPFQQEDAPKYDARRGLIRGTLFQGLDLPFMGMVNTKEKTITPLSELQALGFALQEMALYLDTHRHDKEALALYRAYQDIYHQGMMQYEADCGAMAHGMPSNRDTYAWLDDPWPWEYSKN